jgi:hypothetical protein
LLTLFLLCLKQQITPMPRSGTTKDENHPLPSLPPRGGRIKGEGAIKLPMET